MNRRLTDNRGFTLIELLVVILIIGILATLAVPKFLGQRSSSNNAKATHSVRLSVTSAEGYRTEHDNSFSGFGVAALNANEPGLATGLPNTTGGVSYGSMAAAAAMTAGAHADPNKLYIASDNAGTPPTANLVYLCSASKGDRIVCARGDASGWSWARATSATQTAAQVISSSYFGSEPGQSAPATPVVWSDNFSSDRLASDYSNLAGAGDSFYVSGGVLSAYGVQHRGIRMDAAGTFGDGRITLKLSNALAYAHNPFLGVAQSPSSSTPASVGVRVDNPTGPVLRLHIAQMTSMGSYSHLATSPDIDPGGVGGAPFWLRITKTGNTLLGELFKADPSSGSPTPVASVTYTLTGGRATQFGAGVTGRGAFSLTTTMGEFDDLRVEYTN